jgi:hypothetical protein
VIGLKAWPLLLLAPALTTACGGSGSGENPGARLEVEWSGAASAKVGGGATIEWCDSLRVVELRTLRGDTGIAIAIYPVNQFEPGRFPVVPPARADSARPAAAVALRWFAETSIRGFQADSGQVVVEETGPSLYAGTFEARASSVTDTSSLTIRGSFRGLTVRPALRGCVARRPQPPDSGTDVD